MNKSKLFDGTKTTLLNESYEGQPIFRKIFSSSNEYEIVKILMANPHPNVVKTYRITENFYDMELLKPVSDMFYTRFNIPTFRRDMKRAQGHLRKLGIMYIDWKPDNSGMAKDGHYKLFDFDASGTVNESNEWLIPPPEYYAFMGAKEAGKHSPQEIDDYAFDVGVMNKNSQ